jgi:hypothetical protein
MQRTESFESIPEVDFINTMIEEEIHLIDNAKQSFIEQELLPEPLLVEDKSRFVLFPIKQPDVSSS